MVANTTPDHTICRASVPPSATKPSSTASAAAAAARPALARINPTQRGRPAFSAGAASVAPSAASAAWGVARSRPSATATVTDSNTADTACTSTSAARLAPTMALTCVTSPPSADSAPIHHGKGLSRRASASEMGSSRQELRRRDSSACPSVMTKVA